MRLGVLYSGGKDSTYALKKAIESSEMEVVCLISLLSENKESYMFHTPNINTTKLQAEAIGIPLIQKRTPGEKEKELSDLKKAIDEAKNEYGIEGIVTGAIESVYQASRVQQICDELALWCFNPLWLKDQVELLKEIIQHGFEVIISGIAAYPLDESWLGRKIDNRTVKDLVKMGEKFSISPSGEGGEIETTVLDTPFFGKRIVITDSRILYRGNSGLYIIKSAELVDK